MQCHPGPTTGRYERNIVPGPGRYVGPGKFEYV